MYVHTYICTYVLDTYIHIIHMYSESNRNYGQRGI